MIFSSPLFILVFLPIVLIGYFWLNRTRLALAGKCWLVAASLFFYAYWNLAYLPLLLSSILFNFVVGVRLSNNFNYKSPGFSRKLVFYVGILLNLGLLGYFKYANFFVENINSAFGSGFVQPEILLPLGISFFTFTQIAFLIDNYQGKGKEYNLLSYVLFVSFFPHLIAGPILHHHEMMPQFESRWNLVIRYRNIFRGVFIFSIGLFKKVVLADTFAIWANAGFDNPVALDFFSAWATSLSYTFQLYFDFSGYCDMAIGIALLFNIWMPINFNSPYKALDIQDFWRRWHMTLSRYLKNYLYIPLGGNRYSAKRTYFNLMSTFVLGGLWHGASWMFVIWGGLHGAAVVFHRVWSKFGYRLPKVYAWLITFGFINITWIFFRANSIDDAVRIMRGMIDVGSIIHLPVSSIPTQNLAWLGVGADSLLRWLPPGLVANFLCFCVILMAFILISQKNSLELMTANQNLAKLGGGLITFSISMYSMMKSTSTVFLYFNF